MDYDSLFAFLDDSLLHCTNVCKNLSNYKLKYLNDIYDTLSYEDYYNRKCFINNKRLQIENENSKFINEKHILEAKKCLKSLEDIEAITYLKKINFKIAQSNILIELTSAYSNLLENYFKSQMYDSVYFLYSEYYNYVSPEFKTQYFYAESVSRLKRYSEADRGFEWLINNFDNDQKLISWDKLKKSSAETAAQSGNFDKAARLYQQFYRSDKDLEDLYNYILLQRLKSIYPYLLSTSFLTKQENIKSYNSINRVKVPDNITAVYMIQNGRTFVLDKYRELTPPDIGVIHEINNNIAFIQSDDVVWFVLKIKNNVFSVIELNTNINSYEQDLINDIQKKPLSPGVWLKLNNEIAKNILPYSFSKISNIIESFPSESYLSISKQIWDYISPKTYVEYIILHNSEGKVLEACDINVEDLSFDQLGWDKSSLTPALFIQKVEKMRDKYHFKDYAIPVYYVDHHNVIRFGVKDND